MDGAGAARGGSADELSPTALFLVAFDGQGRPDLGFAFAGMAEVTMPYGMKAARHLVQLADGSLAVGADMLDSDLITNQNIYAALVVLLPDGTIDTRFGGGTGIETFGEHFLGFDGGWFGG
jgi:hypothetical protein